MIFSRSPLLFTVASPSSALLQSSRQVFSAAQSIVQHTSSPRLHSTLSQRFFQTANHHNYSSFSASLSTNPSSLRFSLLSKSHTTSFTSAQQQKFGMNQQHQYRRFTSPSNSSSTASSSVTASAARIISQDASTVAGPSSKTATPLSFHEEMTKVRFSYNWWKEWTIIMVSCPPSSQHHILLASSHNMHPCQRCKEKITDMCASQKYMWPDPDSLQDQICATLASLLNFLKRATPFSICVTGLTCALLV